jgi:hypothetical protein
VLVEYANSPGPSNPSDPSYAKANDLIEEGGKALEEGDIPIAIEKYKASIQIKESSIAWFNLGVSRFNPKTIYTNP